MIGVVANGLTAPTPIKVPSSVGIRAFSFTFAKAIACSNTISKSPFHSINFVIPPY
jgi:hypothetical protein